MENGLMGGRVAMAPEAPPGAAMPAGPHAMPDGTQMPAVDPAGQGEAPELPDEEFDSALERVLAAATQAMRTPQISQQLAQIASAEDQATGIAETANTLLDALDEASGESIPEEILPAATLGIVGIIGQVIGADQNVVGQAADLAIRQAAMAAGMTPEEIEQEMAMGGQTGEQPQGA
jgi:hypothetical protein